MKDKYEQKRKHDGDCQIWRAGVCTCGYLHHILPYIDKWDEKDGEEMARHDMLCEMLFQAGCSLKMPPARSPEEVEKLTEEFRKVWKSLGGTVTCECGAEYYTCKKNQEINGVHLNHVDGE
jgi:hypothetical protein